MGSKAAKAPDGPVLFDADVLIAHMRGVPAAQRFIEVVRFSQRLLPAIVLMEVLQGARDTREMRRIVRWVDGTFSEIVHVTEEMSRRAVSIVQRHALSSRIGAADALIASAALTRQASLATGNVADFRIVAGLRLVPFRARG